MYGDMGTSPNFDIIAIFHLKFLFELTQRPRIDSNKRSLPAPKPADKGSVWVRPESIGTSRWVSSVASNLAIFLANFFI